MSNLIGPPHHGFLPGRGQLFPLGENAPCLLLDFLKRKGIPVGGRYCIMALASGEFRPPKKGEWFLSGAEIQAYRAQNDFPEGADFHIAHLHRVEEEKVKIVESYKLLDRFEGFRIIPLSGENE